MNAAASLHQQVAQFKCWASNYPENQRTGEWECDYEQWVALWAAALSVLQSILPEEWSDECSSNLLYTIARDNETEHIVDYLSTNAEALLKLARLAIDSSERDAKWQLAAQLGALSARKVEAESLLLRLVHDEDEYVSRRALLALGSLKSEQAEALAEKAWQTGQEYQRIAALWVLRDVASSKLGEYVLRAQEDGREYVVWNAREVQLAEEVL